MYATVQRADTADRGGAIEEVRLRQVAGPRELVLRLHPGEAQGPDDYVVEVDQKLADADRIPQVASLATFSGPVSPAVKAAGDRAARDRIDPAMSGHRGAVRMLRLWQPERRSQLILVLATDQGVLEEGHRLIGSMPLLPDEDPALLPGADHVEVFRVLS